MVNIREKLLKDIEEFCELNELVVDDFVNNIIQKGFMDIKWSNYNPSQPTPKKEEIRKEEIKQFLEGEKVLGRNSYGGPDNKREIMKEIKKEEPKVETPQPRAPHIPKKRDLYDE